MTWFKKGGYEVPAPWEHGEVLKYHIETIGQYLRALGSRVIAPVTQEQQHFVDVVEGRALPNSDFESAWLDFINDNPDPRHRIEALRPQ